MHVSDDEEDYALPIWAARIPVRQVIGEPEPCPRQMPDLAIPEDVAPYRPGRTLDDALKEAQALAYQR
jgi:hypothetical protein